MGSSIEHSDCLPSSFKILSERFNFKKKFWTNPQHTHQSLSNPPLLLFARQLWRSLLCLPPRFGWKRDYGLLWVAASILRSRSSEHRRLIAPLCPLVTFWVTQFQLCLVSWMSKQKPLGPLLTKDFSLSFFFSSQQCCWCNHYCLIKTFQ